MKIRWTIFLITCLWMSTATAQQYRFIYLQTENQQTFYVKLDNTVYSSSPSGYLIIPKLTDGTYELQIGFPRNEYPSQVVSCVLSGKDGGYLLKNLGNETWGLFNLRTMEMAKANPGKVSQATNTGKDDSFEGVLSNVVETDLKKKKDRNRDKGKSKKESQQSSGVRMLTTQSDASGLQRVYVDESDDVMDTITVFISGDATVVGKAPTSKPSDDKKDQPTLRFIEPKEQSNTPKQSAPVAMINSDCKQIASEADFIKLRKNMAAKSSEDEMVNVARKAFKKQCYSTDQLKSLSVLLTKDETKYAFLDAAYPYTTDTDQYPTLKSLLTSDYYINRFEAMIRQ